MNKVLLFDTAIATSNIGDEIIFESAKEGLMPVIKNATVYRMGTHVENYSAFQMLIHKIYPQQKIRLINENVDAKFICGTNLLIDNLVHPRPQFMLNYANKSLYREAILVGVGRFNNFTKFKNRYTADLYKKTLSKTFLHSVRDDETKAVLKKLGIESINTGCPTLWMMTPQKCSNIPQIKAENVVFSVSGYKSQQDHKNDKLMIDTILKNYKTVYAWVQTAVDEEYLKNLIDLKKYNIKLIYSLNMYGEILDNGGVDYIGTRLHGGIYALQHNVRSIVVAIDERAMGFHRSNNLPIIQRSEMIKLEELIQGKIVTDIKIRDKEIKRFLSQFTE